LSVDGTASVSGAFSLDQYMDFGSLATPSTAAGRVFYSTDNNTLWFHNGGAWIDLTQGGGGGGLTGSGDVNYLSKWFSGSTLTNSVLYDNGTFVGIGDESPNARLDIVASASGTDYLLYITSYGGTKGDLFTIASSGYVGIGTASPSYNLAVDGTSSISDDLYVGDKLLWVDVSGNFVSMSNDLYVDGTAYFGTDTIAISDHIDFGSLATPSTTTGRLYFDSGTSQLLLYDGSGWQNLASTSIAPDGSVTQNYVARWVDADTLTNSIIYDSGTAIGIGDASPGYTLSIDGTASISDDFYFGNDMLWGDVSTDYVYSSSSWLTVGNWDLDGTASVSGSIAAVGDVTANTFYGDGSNLTGVGSAAASALTFTARVSEATGISKGQCVYISGATGQVPDVSLCDHTDNNKIGVSGIAAETKTNGQTILIRAAGELATVDTDGTGDPGDEETWSDGDQLYMSDNGSLTNVVPASGSVKSIGKVEYAHDSQGKILVFAGIKEWYMAAASGANLEIRMGDSAGATKLEFENYADTDVAYIDSLGSAWF